MPFVWLYKRYSFYDGMHCKKFLFISYFASINCKCGLYRNKPQPNYPQMWYSLVSYGFCYYCSIDKPLTKKKRSFFLIVNTSFTFVYVKRSRCYEWSNKINLSKKNTKSQLYTFHPQSNTLCYESFNIIIQE